MDQYGCTLLYSTNHFARDLNAKGRGDKGKGVKSSRWFRRLTAVTAAPTSGLDLPFPAPSRWPPPASPTLPRRRSRLRPRRGSSCAASSPSSSPPTSSSEVRGNPTSTISPLSHSWARYGWSDAILGCDICLLGFFGSALCRSCSRKVANDRFAVKIRD